MKDERHVEYFKSLLYEKTGISTNDAKSNLLLIKLQRVIRKKNLETYEDYYKLINNTLDEGEIQEFINAFTTNTTEFFRESVHFNYLQNEIKSIINSMPSILKMGEIRAWCSACSTGQEPLTLAMVLKNCVPEGIKIRILATDINSKVLEKASKGFYSISELAEIPRDFLHNYFNEEVDGYSARKELLEIIKYRYFNLMNDFNFKHHFHIIFCRNVMIYFNHETQQKLVNKFYDCMPNGGVFIVGNSESLVNKQHAFTSVGPSIYRKLSV